MSSTNGLRDVGVAVRLQELREFLLGARNSKRAIVHQARVHLHERRTRLDLVVGVLTGRHAANADEGNAAFRQCVHVVEHLCRELTHRSTTETSSLTLVLALECVWAAQRRVRDNETVKLELERNVRDVLLIVPREVRCDLDKEWDLAAFLGLDSVTRFQHATHELVQLLLALQRAETWRVGR